MKPLNVVYRHCRTHYRVPSEHARAIARRKHCDGEMEVPRSQAFHSARRNGAPALMLWTVAGGVALQSTIIGLMLWIAYSNRSEPAQTSDLSQNAPPQGAAWLKHQADSRKSDHERGLLGRPIESRTDLTALPGRTFGSGLLEPSMVQIPAAPPDEGGSTNQLVTAGSPGDPTPLVASCEGEAGSTWASADGWTSLVDPPGERLELPAKLPYQALGAPNPGMLLYPPGALSHMAIGVGSGSIEGFAICDLKTGKSVAVLRGLDIRPEPQSIGGPALSRDGSYFALFDDTKKAVLVRKVKTGEALPPLAIDDSRVGLFFPKADQLLAVPTSGKSPAKRWALPSGKLLESFPVVASPSTEAGRMACSPGGRYLAVAAEGSLPHFVYFYDLETGKKVATFEAPGGSNNLKPWFTAVAFSQDGTEFAAYVAGVQVGQNAGETMNCWDLKTGELVYQKILDRAGRGALGANLGPEPLQWFPDGKGWLLFQQFVVDRDKAAIIQVIDAGGDSFGHFGTKLLDNHRVLASAGSGRMKVVEVRR